MNEVQPSPDLWPVVATTLPVLALALVLESRWLIGRAQRDAGFKLAARINLFLYGANLILMGIAELTALRVLSGSFRDTKGWRDFATDIAILGFSTLILSPGFAILGASLSAIFAWVFTFHNYLWHARKQTRLAASRLRRVFWMRKLTRSNEKGTMSFLEGLDTWLDNRDSWQARAEASGATDEIRDLVRQWGAMADPKGKAASTVLAALIAVELSPLVIDIIDQNRRDLRERSLPLFKKLRHVRSDRYYDLFTYSIADAVASESERLSEEIVTARKDKRNDFEDIQTALSRESMSGGGRMDQIPAEPDDSDENGRP